MLATAVFTSNLTTQDNNNDYDNDNRMTIIITTIPTKTITMTIKRIMPTTR